MLILIIRPIYQRVSIVLNNPATLPEQTKSVKRADFVLKPYMMRDDLVAFWQILNTVLPLLLAAFLIAKLSSTFNIVSFLFVPILFVLIVLLLSRSFSLMHDCGHLSLFKSNRSNRIAAFFLSIIHGIPHYPWSRGHAYHHKYNGNWDRYRGPCALATKNVYDNKSTKGKFLYTFLRHPLLLLPGGFYYLIVKPRVSLILGSIEFVYKFGKSFFEAIVSGQLLDLSKFTKNYHSSYFYVKGEFYDNLANTFCVVSAWFFIGAAIGHMHFWILYSMIMSSSAALMIAVFFIQHNFPGSYASNNEEWSYFKGAIEGSSFLQLPPILNWFTADIAYHHIHHLSERIPNYRLRDCHNANIHLLDNVNPLYMRDIPTCFSLILWDSDNLELISTIDEVFGTQELIAES